MTNFNEEEDNRNFISKGWKLKYWEEVGNDEKNQGPPEIDHYNGPHRHNCVAVNIYNTVLHCTFECT